MNNLSTPVISFVAAKSNSGKTTLLEKVVTRLKEKHIKLAIIKHDAHRFEMDHKGKDTWRMAEAGADVVAISSAEKVAIIEKVNEEKQLDEIISSLPEVDLVLTEGFKRGNKPKIEVLRSTVQQELFCKPEELVAVASDLQWDIGVPCYDINDADGLVREILAYMERFSEDKKVRPHAL